MPTRQRLTREEARTQTRERLIETATRLFAEQGYGGTSLRDIAEQAGYSQGAFYSNFSNKEALLLEMLRRHMAAEAAHLERLIEHGQHGPGQVLDGLEAWASTLDQDINWSMLSIELQLQAQRSEEFAAAYRSVWIQHRDVLGHWIGRLFLEQKRHPPVPAEEIAASLMALAHGLSLQHAATGCRISGGMIVVLLRGLMAMGSPC